MHAVRTQCEILDVDKYSNPSFGPLGVLSHGARTVRARCGPCPVFPGILPSGEAHNKPLWRVFPNACGWSPKAFG